MRGRAIGTGFPYDVQINAGSPEEAQLAAEHQPSGKSTCEVEEEHCGEESKNNGKPLAVV
ncbi:MAG: hypothetical protein ABI680_05905 [Chthoniobacteraceae bacterium]